MKPLDYVNISTNLPFDNDIEHVSCNAFRCFIEMICLAGFDLSDGLVSSERLRKFCNAPDIGNALQELMDGGYVEADGNGNYLLINYLKWNKSREDIERLRSMNAVRVMRFRGAVSKSKSKSIDTPPTSPIGEELTEQTKKPRKKPTPQEYTVDFEQWWSLYPRKDDKFKSFEQYRSACKITTKDVLLDRLKAQLPMLTSREPQYIPIAKTWLYQRQWENPVDSGIDPELAAVLAANQNVRRMR